MLQSEKSKEDYSNTKGQECAHVDNHSKRERCCFPFKLVRYEFITECEPGYYTRQVQMYQSGLYACANKAKTCDSYRIPVLLLVALSLIHAGNCLTNDITGGTDDQVGQHLGSKRIALEKTVIRAEKTHFTSVFLFYVLGQQDLI